MLKLFCYCLVFALLVPCDWLVGAAKGSTQPAALAAACTTSQIKISEVEADTSQSGTDSAFEWFELFNTGSECEMDGWTITDNVQSDNLFSGSGGSNVVRIATSGHIIVAANMTNFTNNHTFSGALIEIGDGKIGNGLSNSSDFLILKNSSGSAVDCVTWGNPSSNPCGFSVSPPPSNDNKTLQRTPDDGTDTDSASDWTNANAETPSGSPTAVTLSSLIARSAKTRVVVHWETVNEFDIVGFNLLRGEAPDGPFDQINPALIPSQGSGTVTGARYRYADEDVISGSTYFYVLESVNLDGTLEQFGPVTVRFHRLDLLDLPLEPQSRPLLPPSFPHS